MSKASVSNAIKRFKETCGNGITVTESKIVDPKFLHDRDDRSLARTSLHETSSKIKE